MMTWDRIRCIKASGYQGWMLMGKEDQAILSFVFFSLRRGVVMFLYLFFVHEYFSYMGKTRGSLVPRIGTASAFSLPKNVCHEAL